MKRAVLLTVVFMGYGYASAPTPKKTAKVFDLEVLLSTSAFKTEQERAAARRLINDVPLLAQRTKESKEQQILKPVSTFQIPTVSIEAEQEPACCCCFWTKRK